MNLTKKYLLTAVALLSMSLSKLSIAEEVGEGRERGGYKDEKDLSPIEGHVCNNILEFAQKENGGVKIPTLERLLRFSSTKISQNYSLYPLTLETYVLYGKCLLLNSTDPLEKSKGLTILQSIGDRLDNYPSLFFLAQYLEMETGHENIEGLEKILSAYENVIRWLNINAGRFTFSRRLANTVVFLTNHRRLLTQLAIDSEWFSGSLAFMTKHYYRNLQAPPLSLPLFINSDWWLIEEMAYYKVPQLHLISTISYIKNLSVLLNPEENPFLAKNPLSKNSLLKDVLDKGPSTFLPPSKIGGEEATKEEQEGFSLLSPIRTSFMPQNFPSEVQIIENIEDSIINIIDSAERCMSDLNNYRLNKSIVPSIYSACEELREIALDFSNGSRSITLEEAENLEVFLQSQEEHIRALIDDLKLDSAGNSLSKSL